ncbi:flavin reductase family protein [Nocardia brasiliensis]|uniref:flavin reductase family protein n=1 Tax=Nocardia brasiliensis TaxID=37326 RepID=UPI0018936EE6|nr:flavin reductase family protein [Nocardia brasiliensis]MBF6130415.1 flavin reductase family protein [Nocardia brasiliensis]MBF6544849.1 flavin reductase family protein [Nocardia brasiliensis]
MTGSAELRRVLGAFTTGVTVITTGWPRPHGMTANAFTSVSLDPPLILVCVAHTARLHRAIQEAGAFAVSVLSADQEVLARYFADSARPDGTAQFRQLDWYAGPHTGAPLLAGTVAGLECKLDASHDCGDHSIVIGEVVHAERHPDFAAVGALAFYDGGYRPFLP